MCVNRSIYKNMVYIVVIEAFLTVLTQFCDNEWFHLPTLQHFSLHFLQIMRMETSASETPLSH